MGALAYDCRSLERDATPVTSVRVICSGCDPDNPRSVPRSRCKKCRGTGTCGPEMAAIAREIHNSRLELLLGKSGKGREDFDD